MDFWNKEIIKIKINKYVIKLINKNFNYNKKKPYFSFKYMKKGNISNISQTTTLLEKRVTAKARKILYLVLQKKGLAEEAIESIDKELEKRLIEYLNNIAPKLNQTNFDDPEKALRMFTT